MLESSQCLIQRCKELGNAENAWILFWKCFSDEGPTYRVGIYIARYIDTINNFGKTNKSLMRCGWEKSGETMVCSPSKNHCTVVHFELGQFPAMTLGGTQFIPQHKRNVFFLTFFFYVGKRVVFRFAAGVFFLKHKHEKC